jgi:hypothetical protein
MEDYLGENSPARLPGRKYAHSEASEKISEASGAPQEGLEGVAGTGGEALVYQRNKTNGLQAQRVVRGYCAMSAANNVHLCIALIHIHFLCLHKFWLRSQLWYRTLK